jgi:hypothetical protein
MWGDTYNIKKGWKKLKCYEAMTVLTLPYKSGTRIEKKENARRIKAVKVKFLGRSSTGTVFVRVNRRPYTAEFGRLIP